MKMPAESFKVVLDSDNPSETIESPSAQEIESLMINPKQFSIHPLMEGVNLQCCSSLPRSDPDYKTGIVELFFDHHGCCVMTYNMNNGQGVKVLFDPQCESDEIVTLETIDEIDWHLSAKYLVAVEFAKKYVHEFCDTGEISLSEDVWEKWSIAAES